MYELFVELSSHLNVNLMGYARPAPSLSRQREIPVVNTHILL
jgi:hypothetical protein